MADSQPEPQNDPMRPGTPVGQRMQTPTTSVSPAEAVSPAAKVQAGDGNKRSPRPRRQAQAHKTSSAPAAMDGGSRQRPASRARKGAGGNEGRRRRAASTGTSQKQPPPSPAATPPPLDDPWAASIDRGLAALVKINEERTPTDTDYLALQKRYGPKDADGQFVRRRRLRQRWGRRSKKLPPPRARAAAAAAAAGGAAGGAQGRGGSGANRGGATSPRPRGGAAAKPGAASAALPNAKASSAGSSKKKGGSGPKKKPPPQTDLQGQIDKAIAASKRKSMKNNEGHNQAHMLEGQQYDQCLGWMAGQFGQRWVKGSGKGNYGHPAGGGTQTKKEVHAQINAEARKRFQEVNWASAAFPQGRHPTLAARAIHGNTVERAAKTRREGGGELKRAGKPSGPGPASKLPDEIGRAVKAYIEMLQVERHTGGLSVKEVT